jgi:hypothetical protein
MEGLKSRCFSARCRPSVARKLTEILHAILISEDVAVPNLQLSTRNLQLLTKSIGCGCEGL